MKKQQNDSAALLWSVGIGAAAMIVFSVVIAFITSKLGNPIEYLTIAAGLSAFAGGLGAGITCAKKCAKSVLIYALIAGGIIALLMIMVSLIGGGTGNTLARVLMPAAAIAGSALPPLFIVRGDGSKKRLRQIKRIR